MNNFLGIVLSATFTTSAMAADQLVPETKSVSYHDTWSVGVGLGVSSEAERWQFSAKTPTLFSVANKWGSADYSLFGEAGALSVPNIAVEGEKRLQDVSSLLAVLGLESRKPTIASGSWTYMQLGLAYLNGDKDLWKSKDHFGGKLGFGFEVGISEMLKNDESSKSLGVFFAEYNLLFGLGRADKLPGEPDLANGSSILIGGRSYW